MKDCSLCGTKMILNPNKDGTQLKGNPFGRMQQVPAFKYLCESCQNAEDD